VQAATAGLPLIGTAGSCSAIVAIELASPWAPRLKGSASSDPGLDAALERIGDRTSSLRVLFYDGDGRSEDGLHRVLLFDRGSGAFGGFTRREIAAPRAELAQVIDAIDFDPDGRVVAAPRLAAHPLHGPREQGRDIFVCTHGSRDACCGKMGFPLYRHLCERMAAPGVRLWRCSHLGGHRFAPTLLDLPSGRLFGHLRFEDAEWLHDGDAGSDRIRKHYRGLCALPAPAQVLERRMWERHGLRWLDARLLWRCEEEGDHASVELSAFWQDGAQSQCRGEVQRRGGGMQLVAESCGRDPEPPYSWELTSWSESRRLGELAGEKQREQ